MRALTISLLWLMLMALAPIEHASPSTSAGTAFLYTAAQSYEPLAWIQGGDRFPSGAHIFIRDANGRHAFLPRFAASADPDLSFDGKYVLFAGKRTAQEKWQIWETSLDGKDLRRITNCADDCVRAFYLPDDRVVYAEKVSGRFVIQTMSTNGSQPLALTYGPGNSLPTDVLRDGRVLFEASFPFGEKGIPELYTVYSDGSGVESYRCDHGVPRHAGKQVESGDIVFASGKGLARFTSARAKEVEISAPVGEYAGDVAETNAGNWLISSRTNGRFQLMWWKPGEPNLRAAVEQQGSDAVQPVFVKPRPVPKRHPSGLHDWSVGNLLCLNAYASKYKFAEATVRSVRLYARSGNGESQLLGTAPVEPDGSFFVQVTGDQPLQIELVDASSKTLKRETGWFWLRRGEQRACVGCHAGPETAPENAVPMVLLKSTTPADMTHPVASVAPGGH